MNKRARLKLAMLLHRAARKDDPDIPAWGDLPQEKKNDALEIAEMIGEGVNLLVDLALARVEERADA